jgi:hypothetical protein
MSSLNKKRIFISFAVPEDTYARDFLVGQAKNSQTPFEFINMSVKEPWSELWKDKCRTKIKGCDGFIALLSKSTLNATGARWEMRCAVEERVPVIGMYIKREEKFVPQELSRQRVIEWSWDEIARFISSL